MKRLIATILVLILTISLCPALAEYTDSETILAVQEALADAGIYKGNLSGIKGNATENAIRTYQQKNGLKVNGQIDDDLLDSLGLLSDEVILVSKITLNEENVSLSKGGTVTLTSTVEPKNARNKKVEWSSTDETVATVKDGKVTAKANGTCDIICHALDDSGVETVCHVAVIVMVTSVTTTQNQKVKIPYGGSVELTATAKPEDATNTVLRWSSSDESVCVVDENGKVTSVGSGDCEIECSTTDGSKKSIKFQIHVPIFEAIEATHTITEKGWNLIPIDLHGAYTGDISYTASTEKYFMYYFDKDGIHIYPITEGKAQITLTSKHNKQDKMTINVKIEKSATYADEEEPLTVIVTTDQNEVNPGERFNVKYRISGGTPPYDIVKADIYYSYDTGGTVSYELKMPKASEGQIGVLSDSGNDYCSVKINVADSSGNVAVGQSNLLTIKSLKVDFDRDYYALIKNKTHEIGYSITGGSGKYKVKVKWSARINGTQFYDYKEETITSESTGVIIFNAEKEQVVQLRLEVYDSQNNRLSGYAYTPAILLTDDWEIYVEYDKKPVFENESVVAKLILNNAPMSKINSAYLEYYTYKSGWISIMFNDRRPVTFVNDGENNIAILTVPDPKALAMSLKLTIDESPWKADGDQSITIR